MRTLALLPAFQSAVRILSMLAFTVFPSAWALAETVTPFTGKPGANLGEGVLPERFALVVGINRYDTTGTLGLNDLSNAENDAEGIASELTEAGFTTFVLTTERKIKTAPNESPYIRKNEILNKLSTVINYASKSRERVGRAPIILFYFAGHGLNMDGDDYVLPSDFKPSFAEDVSVMAISIKELANRISWAEPALKIIISDACRTRSPAMLVKRSSKSEIASLAPGNQNLRLVESAKVTGINDTILAFATLGDQAAADSGEKWEHGKFAGAFMTALRNARDKARKADAYGEPSAASEILHRTKQMMDLDKTSVQGSEFIDRATSFLFHPTEKNFNDEKDVWLRAQEYTGTSTNEGAILKALYCSFQSFILVTSYYSYFGAAALDRLKRYSGGVVGCQELKTTASESDDLKFLKPLQGGWVERVPESARSPALAIPIPLERGSRCSACHDVERPAYVAAETGLRYGGEMGAGSSEISRSSESTEFSVLAQSYTPPPSKSDDLKIKDLGAFVSSEALGEVAGFDPEVRVDDLAVASADLGLYADVKLARRIAGIGAGDLLQVLRIVNENVMNVRTANGRTGFVRQRSVDSGRIAVKFQVSMRDVANLLQYDNKIVDPILRSGVIADMQVRFPSKDKLMGYAHAQIAADHFARSSLRLDQKIRRFVPSIISSSSEGEDAEDSVWVVTTLLPLVRDVRLRFLSSSGESVRAQDAIDLADLPQRSVLSARSAEPLSEECVAAAEENRRLMNSKVTAYVQFMPDAQRSQSELIRNILKAGGFYPPAAEKISVSPPAAHEVRVCADQNKNAASLARDLLDKCKVGRFVSRQIPACRKKFPADTIEIWLGATNNQD